MGSVPNPIVRRTEGKKVLILNQRRTIINDLIKLLNLVLLILILILTYLKIQKGKESSFQITMDAQKRPKRMQTTKLQILRLIQMSLSETKSKFLQ